MNSTRTLALVILLPFALLSGYAIAQVGYLGILTYHVPSPAGWQVFTDLVIAIVLICLWMIRDARSTGRNPWPYVVASLFLGSFGVLFYLLLSPTPSREAVRQPA